MKINVDELIKRLETLRDNYANNFLVILLNDTMSCLNGYREENRELKDLLLQQRKRIQELEGNNE